MAISAKECHARAQECIELAKSVPESERSKFLEIAEAWLALASEGVAMVSADPVLDVPPRTDRH